ncbi:hypothetical protein M0P65_00115 [Candidatus Gracilibacteria bacterium]|nr:hypothetical protein [Candidatus Gracilibacteria bacterium]
MLTPKQQKVFDVIKDYILKHGESPTLEEIQNILGIQNKRSVAQFLEYLDEKGYIRRAGGYRGIKLGDRIVASQIAIPIPIFGVVNAGRPLNYAEEVDAGYLHISKNLIKGDLKKYFCVKVEGTSMNKFKVNGKNIEDGSFILVDKSINWNDDLSGAYVCVVNSCATVKKIKKEGEQVYLIPESTDEIHHPIVITSDDTIEINGKVVDVFNF